MRNSSSMHSGRTRATSKRRRLLDFQRLESRNLLASLTSRLPPITLTPSEEPVQIQLRTDSEEQLTLPSSAVLALRQIEELQQSRANSSTEDVDQLLSETQQDVWHGVLASLQPDASFELPEIETAIDIARTGFEVASPPRDSQTIFGPPLSTLPDTSPVTSPDNEPVEQPPSAEQERGAGENPLPLLNPVARDRTDTDDTGDATRPDKAPDDQVAEGADDRAESDGDEAAGAAVPGDPSQGDEIAAGADGMLLLIPSNMPDETDRVTDKPETRYQPATQPEASDTRQANQSLDDMLLLPMADESAAGDEAHEPRLAAGFNPFSMLQIFVGAAQPSVEHLHSSAAQRSGDEDAAGGWLAMVQSQRIDQLAVGVFLAIAGYAHYRRDRFLPLLTGRDSQPRLLEKPLPRKRE